MAVTVFEVDLDEEVISHLALPESIEEFRAERMDPSLIEDAPIRAIYEWAMNHLKEHGKPPTPSVLAEEFNIGFQEPLTAILDLIDRLRVRWMTNHAREHMEEVADTYKEDPRLVPAKLMEQGRKLSHLILPKGERVVNEDFGRIMDAYDKRVLAGPGPALGFDEIDDYFHGLRGMATIIGSPKSKKSWFCVKAMLANVLDRRVVVHYPLELPAFETAERLYCMAANVPPWKMLKGSLALDDRKILQEATEFIDDQGLYHIIKPPPGQRKIVELIENARDLGADVIFFDQLQYIETDKGRQLGSGDHTDYWNVLNTARDLSDDGPLVFVHQFNRTAAFAEEMPDMSQAKGAAAVEETMSLVMGLWANKDMRRSGVTEFGALAARHFDLNSWEIGVDLNRGCRFECLGEVIREDNE